MTKDSACKNKIRITLDTSLNYSDRFHSKLNESFDDFPGKIYSLSAYDETIKPTSILKQNLEYKAFHPIVVERLTLEGFESKKKGNLL